MNQYLLNELDLSPWQTINEESYNGLPFKERLSANKHLKSRQGFHKMKIAKSFKTKDKKEACSRGENSEHKEGQSYIISFYRKPMRKLYTVPTNNGVSFKNLQDSKIFAKKQNMGKKHSFKILKDSCHESKQEPQNSKQKVFLKKTQFLKTFNQLRMTKNLILPKIELCARNR